MTLRESNEYINEKESHQLDVNNFTWQIKLADTSSINYNVIISLYACVTINKCAY